MSGGLFRDAAIRAAHDKLGTPFGQPSGRRRLIVALMLVILTTSFVFLAITRFAKKETVSGEVYSQAGVTRLTPIRGGTIREVLVRSGDRVSQGQALFIMSYDTMLEDGALLSGKINLAADIQSRSMSEQADMKVAQIQQDRAELQQRLSGIEKDLQSSDEQELIQTRRLAIADENLESFKALFDKGFTSSLNLKLREDTALAIRQALSQLRQQIEQTRSQKLQLKAQISRNGFALREAQASRKVADAQFVEKRLNTASAQFGRINAPKTGSITSLQAKAGDVVASGQLLGFLIAQQNKQPQLINLWVPSRAIGLVRVDKVVRLLSDPYPDQTYGVGLGHVVEVAGVPMMPSELPTPIETREQMYKVVVELDPLARTVDGEPWRLTPGMRVTADLVLDEKSLLAWLLDPLIAANRRAAS